MPSKHAGCIAANHLNRSLDVGRQWPQCLNILWEKKTEHRSKKGTDILMCLLCYSLRTINSPNMMPEGMTHMIPNHVLRVGQTIRLDPTPETDHRHDDLDISLENLNRIILEMDPTFEPIHMNTSPPSSSPATGRPPPQRHLLLHLPLFSGLHYIMRR